MDSPSLLDPTTATIFGTSVFGLAGSRRTQFLGPTGSLGRRSQAGAPQAKRKSLLTTSSTRAESSPSTAQHYSRSPPYPCPAITAL
ncbi:hypothetical protein JHW43_004114 [Diplocarpon mali]|nr:hypothetical protein JHW43_004114 [Diplocarpon mali]